MCPALKEIFTITEADEKSTIEDLDKPHKVFWTYNLEQLMLNCLKADIEALRATIPELPKLKFKIKIMDRGSKDKDN
jgi:hypothetical protein